jgi:gas vesicle protein
MLDTDSGPRPEFGPRADEAAVVDRDSETIGLRATRRCLMRGGSSMGFIMGLLTGLVVGAIGAVFYSIQTGRDLRDEFEQVRTQVQKRDFDALANLVDQRFRELQTGIDERIAQVRDAASKATNEAQSAAEDAAGDAKGSNGKEP